MYRRPTDSDAVRSRNEPQANRQSGQTQKNEKQQRVKSTPKQLQVAERDMMEQFQMMMDTYQIQQKRLGNRKAWVSNDRTWHGPFKDEPPSEMTVTHINQTKDLFDGSGLETAFSQFQTSKEWLVAHSLKTMKLTLKDLVNRGKLQRSTVNKDSGKVQQRLQFEGEDIASFELRINVAIQTYSRRIKWLLQGSRKMFGTVHGRNVALMVDCSDACLGFGRRSPYVQALTHLLDEQLSLKKGLYACSFGTDILQLWVSDSARTVNDSLVDEARQWLDRLINSGGCNLLEAIKHAYTINGLHTACIVVGSLPDQNMNVLYHYVEQMALQKPLRLYIVSYECPHHEANATFKKLAELTDGSYHCFSSTEVDQIYSSTDIAVLLDEVRAAQDLINRITQMKLGYLGTALVTISDQIKKQVNALPPSRFYPRPVGHDLPLTLDMPSFSASTSSDWLLKHGLKAKGLDLYQVLAPNAYSYLEEFIPVIRKTVQSQVHSRAMAQFQWHDGTMKNVHVDMSLLFEYQKQLGSVVKLYEKRIDWLSCASRRLFGSVTENNLIIILDASLFNSSHIVHIQNTLRHVFQEQMCNKQYLNIIAFGEEIQLWKPSMVKITGDVLQEAWKWVLKLHCSGGRNIMGALRRAFECDDLASTVDVEGVYLITSGVPDQSADVVQSYIEETAAGRSVRLHVILFNVDDRDLLVGGIVAAPGVSSPGDGCVLPCRYASITQTAEILRQLAHSSPGGRFHWYRETGIIESDDLSLISLEIEKAINFSKKCQMLVESVKKKDSLDMKFLEMMPDSEQQSFDQQQPTSKPLPPPRETALSQSRKKKTATDKDKDSVVPKTLAYKEGQLFKASRPTSASGSVDGGSDFTSKGKRSKGPKAEQAFFYTGNKNDVGAVFRQYQNKPINSGGKAIPSIAISDKEDQVTTKEWLRKHSLSKLHLNLNKMALGSGRSHVISHVTEHVSTINKTVEAKSCHVFPTVNVSGTQRHLLLTPVQLLEYQQQIRYVLTRYLQRLQWLLAGSRRVFGTVVEKTCVLLIDTSGSMEERMAELKKELIALVWEQLHKHHIKFNLIAFSRTCVTWQSNLVDSTEENCHEAAQWISQLTADGNTCTLEALQMAFSQCRNLNETSSGNVAVYLLTDGKPDTSMSMVLNEVRQMNSEKQIVINTISFNCQDSLANEFLKSLASENRGRYHCVVHRHVSDGGFDVHRFAHQLIESDFESPDHPVMPELSGDDVVRLALEVQKGRRFIAQSRTYLELYDDLKKAQQPAHDCFTVGPSSKFRPTSAKP